MLNTFCIFTKVQLIIFIRGVPEYKFSSLSNIFKRTEQKYWETVNSYIHKKLFDFNLLVKFKSKVIFERYS